MRCSAPFGWCLIALGASAPGCVAPSGPPLGRWVGDAAAGGGPERIEVVVDSSDAAQVSLRSWRLREAPMAQAGEGLMFWIVTSLVLVASASGQSSGSPQTKPAAKQTVRQLEISNKPWTGDFDQMLERRGIRVVVPYSRSLYFNDKGHERGLTAETVRDFERWINKKYAGTLGKRPLTVYIIPTTRDKLLPELVSGLGDAAIGNLTVTEERLKIADFVSPEGVRIMKELVVTGPQSPAIASVDDLSGTTVHVRKASSYYESLVLLNERFEKEGKSPVKLVLVPDALEDEDMMEMLNAGLLSLIVVDMLGGVKDKRIRLLVAVRVSAYNPDML